MKIKIFYLIQIQTSNKNIIDKNEQYELQVYIAHLLQKGRNMKERRDKFRKILIDNDIDAILIKSKSNKRYIGALPGSGV